MNGEITGPPAAFLVLTMQIKFNTFAYIKGLMDRIPPTTRLDLHGRFSSRFWKTRPHGAFSLVEVTLAIGLTTVALLVIFSLMPVGISSLQVTNQQIVGTEIYNTVGAELESTSFDQLDAYVTSRFPIYFDNEGIETGAGGTAVFTATCTLKDPELSGELRRGAVVIALPGGGRLSQRPLLLVRKGS